MSSYTDDQAMTPEVKAMFNKAGDYKNFSKAECIAAQEFVAKALETPLRQGIVSGDILGNLFDVLDYTDGETIEYELDFLVPGSERDFYAYTVPNRGAVPMRHVEADYVKVPTYRIASSIDTHMRYLKKARSNVRNRMMEVLEGGITKKLNDDGWHTILGSAVDRNLRVFDADAAVGVFTKRLVALLKTVMIRNGGGNSTSRSGFRVTDLYMSPEGNEDIMNWNVDQIDEMTRRDIFLSEDGGISRIFGVNLHQLRELGVGQEYQLYYTNDLSGTMGLNDEEIVVCIDQSKDTLIMPVEETLQVYVDDQWFRERIASFWCDMRIGFGSMDNRNVIIGSY